MLGYSYESRPIQICKRSWHFEHKKGPNNEILLKIEKDSQPPSFYHPYEISGMLLRHMMELVKRSTGEEVKEAVITVPAYFSMAQRAETLKAADFAGITVLCLLNEPTAAVIGYEYETQEEVNHTTLVFDFGGGTLDVSLISVEKNAYRVLAVDGENHLGGRDFDERLIQYCLEKFDPQNTMNVRSNSRAMSLFQAKCEQAKT